MLGLEELDAAWDPTKDNRLTIWEITHHLAKAVMEKGDSAAAELLAKVGPQADAARDLAYRLYTVCERKGWAQEAMPYNMLVINWSDMGQRAQEVELAPKQGTLGI